MNKKNNSMVSLVGLIIAFTAFFYIYSIVSFETSYDSYHKDSERIYRVSGDIIAAENTMTHAIIGPLLGPELKNEFPAVESYARLIPVRHSVKLEVDNQSFLVDEAYTTDASVFDIFSFHFIYGHPSQALINANEIVINESLSHKMFGTINPIGKTIVRDGTPLKVAGVVKDSPDNSHHKLNVLFAMGDWFTNREGISDMRVSEAYWMPSCYLFIKLYEGASIESITNDFEPFYNKYMATFGNHLNAKFAPVAIALKDLHFSRNMSYDYPKGSRSYAKLFIAIGVFILLIAFINYSNLLVAQNGAQSKNIGIRKINGAGQGHIYMQLFVNSALIIAVAMLSAVMLYMVSLPFFKSLLLFKANPLAIQTMVQIAVGFTLVLASLTALIPFLNQVKHNGLKLIVKTDSSMLKEGQLSFAKISSIAQLSLSIVLLIAIMIISKQLTFLTDGDMGFDKENVVLLKLNKTVCKPEMVQSLKEELLRDANIESVAFSRFAPGEVLASFHFQMDRDGKTVTKIIGGMEVDYDYISLMKMELIEGRNFGSAYNDKHNSVIINEAGLRFIGMTAPAVGKKIEDITIIGTLKDVSFNSLHNETEPFIFYLGDTKEGYLNIRLHAKADLKASLVNINQSWEAFVPNETAELQFLDNRIKMLYDDDYAKGKLISAFTLISLIISLMGLFNLSILKSYQRTKEIGIRKVNGAKVSEILALLNADFVKWVAIAFVIACPIAWYAMDKWLQNFAYKTEMSWWVFVLGGICALAITILTVSWQSWKAARRNPVEALRYE